jgi:hypothetical protein
MSPPAIAFWKMTTFPKGTSQPRLLIPKGWPTYLEEEGQLIPITQSLVPLAATDTMQTSTMDGAQRSSQWHHRRDFLALPEPRHAHPSANGIVEIFFRTTTI